MKVVVNGGTGLIGSKVVQLLNAHGHDASAAAAQTGCNTLTGEGVDEASSGTDVVVDVSSSASFADDDVLHFFTTSTNNLLDAEKRMGAQHDVALSIVGCDRLPRSGYLRAKVAQEELIREPGRPYSIIRATQFFESTTAIADAAMIDGKAHLAPVHYQPMAPDDVVAAVGRTAAGEPHNGVLEPGGREPLRMDEFMPAVLRENGDGRAVVVDEHAMYFGTEPADDRLVPGPDAELGTMGYRAWAEARSSA